MSVGICGNSVYVAGGGTTASHATTQNGIGNNSSTFEMLPRTNFTHVEAHVLQQSWQSFKVPH